ncbi:MAG: sensor histidine kinase [Oligoflexia bacterium]|nr:sensor histidine kinase [Oligoflexia bacterium]
MQFCRYDQIIKALMLLLALVIVSSLTTNASFANDQCTFDITNITTKTQVPTQCMEYYIDLSNKLNLSNIVSKQFTPFQSSEAVLPNTSGTLWIRYYLTNNKQSNKLYLGFKRTFMDLQIFSSPMPMPSSTFKLIHPQASTPTSQLLGSINWKNQLREKRKNSKIGTEITFPNDSHLSLYFKVKTRYIPNLTHYFYANEVQFLEDTLQISIFHFFMWGFIISLSILFIILSKNQDLCYLRPAGIFLILVSSWSINLDYKIFTPAFIDFEALSSMTQFSSQIIQIFFCRLLFDLNKNKASNLYSLALISFITIYLFIGLFLTQDFNPTNGLYFFAVINLLTLPFLLMKSAKTLWIDKVAYLLLLGGYLMRVAIYFIPFDFLKQFVAYAPWYGLFFFSLLSLVSVYFKVKHLVTKMAFLENIRANFNLIKQKEINSIIKYVIHEFKNHLYDLLKYYSIHKNLLVFKDSAVTNKFSEMLIRANLLAKTELLDYRDGHNPLTLDDVELFLNARIKLTSAKISYKLISDRSSSKQELQMNNIDFKNMIKPLLSNSIQSVGNKEKGSIVITTKIVSDTIALIQIKDNGEALPKELLHQKHTKKPSLSSVRGTGIGLSQVCEVMEKYNGILSFERSEQWNFATIKFETH